MMSTSLHVRIEPLARKHLGDELEAAHQSVEHTQPWMEWCRADLSRDELEGMLIAVEEAWERGDQYLFAIVDAASGWFLGAAGLNRIDNAAKTANLHYWVRAGCTGRGIATEGARQVAMFGLAEKGFQRISIVVPVGNRASEGVARKLGAHREGILRNACRHHGQQMDAIVYSLIPEDLVGVLAA